MAGFLEEGKPKEGSYDLLALQRPLTITLPCQFLAVETLTCAAVSSGPLFWVQKKWRESIQWRAKGKNREKLRPEKYVTQIKREKNRKEWKPSSTIVTTTNIQRDFTFQCLTFESLKWQTTEANFIWTCRSFSEKRNTGWWPQYSEPVYCRGKGNR